MKNILKLTVLECDICGEMNDTARVNCKMCCTTLADNSVLVVDFEPDTQLMPHQYRPMAEETVGHSQYA